MTNTEKIKHNKEEQKEIAENLSSANNTTSNEFSKKDFTQRKKRFANLNSEEIKLAKRNRKKWIIIWSIVAAIVVLSIAAAALYSFLNMSFSDDDLKARQELSATSFDEPFYMVLIGTDTREGSSYKLEDGRSDSCVVVRIDPITFTVTMISVPRDTKITNNGYTKKFNACYAEGGVTSTIKEIKALLGIEISHYAEISFNGLTDMVDAVGGVEVEVPSEINDPNAGYVAAGKQTLNGEQALAFSRSRYFGDGDFTRTADQRILIEALIQKAYHMPLSDLPNLLRAAKNFVKTDLRLGDMVGLATQFINADKQLTIYSAMVPSYNDSEGGISYVSMDKGGWRRMKAMIENGENPIYVELTTDAQVCSSRDAADLPQKREQYFKEHPDSKGRIVNDPGASSDSSYSNNNYSQNYNSTYNNNQSSQSY